MSQNSSNIAVLIDSDNVSSTHIAGVLGELAKYGTTSVRRMYGDWTSDRLRGWKEAANEYSIQPIQQFSYTTGKNSTDSALIIDAMDLLHQNRLDMFAIISSDSDFTRLAARLRESGARVFGFGQRKTPKPFVNACNTFTYFEALQVDASDDDEPASNDTKAAAPASGASTGGDADSGPPPRATTKELRQDSRLVNLLRQAIAAGADDDGWTLLSELGSTVQKQSSDFDSRNWGYAKLRSLIEAVGLFEIGRVQGQNGHTNLQVRVPPKKSKK